MTKMVDLKPQHFLWACENRVATIRLDRPDRKNPLTFDSYAELRDTFRDLAYADDVDVVVFASNGGNFCSGGDVNDIIGPLVDMDMKDLLAFTRMTGDFVKAMIGCGKPIIAAVDGVCVGAGAIVAMACDLRIATPDAKCAFLFTRVGLAGCDMGACAMLPRIIGQGRAAELLYTGRSMKADEGAAWGFWNALHPAEQLDDAAQELADRLAAGPTFAHGITKTQLNQEWNMGLEQAIEAEAQAQAICMQTQDFETRLSCLCSKTETDVRGQLMADKSFLDWPFFEPHHRRLAEALEEWASSNLGGIDLDNADTACRSLVASLGHAGFLLHSAVDPENETGLDVRSLCLIRETLARHDGLADFSFAMQGLGTGAISLFGTAEQKGEWLPKTRTGRAISAFALTEPQSGSDVANSTMSATRDGDEYVLNGEKTWISNGGIADVYTLFARTGEAAGARGLSAFIVPAGLPGFEVAERLETIAPHPLARLSFNDCRVPASALLGEPGQGFRIAMSVLDVFRSTVAAAALGFARRALDEALDRVSSRQVQGAPLFNLQMVQGHIADMAVDVDAAALLVYRAAWAKDMGAPRVTREAAMAKLFATDHAQDIIDRAVQLHGGDGVKSGEAVEKLYREIRALRIYEGASDVQRVVIARQAMDQYLGG